MAVFALDPSTTCMGWCIAERNGDVTDFGLVRPARRSDQPEWRVTSMLDQLPRWGDVSVVVIERPPLMPRKGSHQMIAAWGRVYEWCRLALDPAEILTPMPRSWMGGESKAERGARIAAQFELYDPREDRGYDVADAIGLAQWFHERGRRLAESG